MSEEKNPYESIDREALCSFSLHVKHDEHPIVQMEFSGEDVFAPFDMRRSVIDLITIEYVVGERSLRDVPVIRYLQQYEDADVMDEDMAECIRRHIREELEVSDVYVGIETGYKTISIGRPER